MFANDHQNVPSITHVCKQAWSHSKRFLQQLVLCKEMGTVQTEYETTNELRKSLSLIQLIGIGLGGTIGTGIFVLSGQAAATSAGPSVIISFVIAGIVALLSALSMAEMASLMASCGSAYTYAYVALGEYPAFFIGWLSTLLYQLGTSVAVIHWSRFVVHFINQISDYNITSSIVGAPVAWSEESNTFYRTGQVINIPAIAITIAITVVLLIGIRETAIFNLILVVFKVGVLLLFIFACCGYVDCKNYEPFFPSNQGSITQFGVAGMLEASAFVFFAYVGFESVTTAAQEAKEPARYISVALILSLVISLLIYVGVCTVMVGLVPYAQLNTDYPLFEAVKGTPYGIWLPILLDLGAIASITTVAVTLFIAQSRILYALAHDGLLPLIFAKVDRNRKTPWVSIVITGICPVDVLGGITSIGALITYLSIHICLVKMRYTHDDIPRPFRVACGRWLVPGVGILLCILLLSRTHKGTAIRFGVWMGICQIVYFAYSYWFSKVRLQNNAQLLTNDDELPSEPETTENRL